MASSFSFGKVHILAARLWLDWLLIIEIGFLGEDSCGVVFPPSAINLPVSVELEDLKPISLSGASFR